MKLVLFATLLAATFALPATAAEPAKPAQAPSAGDVLATTTCGDLMDLFSATAPKLGKDPNQGAPVAVRLLCHPRVLLRCSVGGAAAGAGRVNTRAPGLGSIDPDFPLAAPAAGRRYCPRSPSQENATWNETAA